MKKRDTVITIAVLFVAFIVILYRQFSTEPTKVEEIVIVAEEEAALREISTVVSYEAPGKTDIVEFTVFVNEAGEIQDILTVDLNSPKHTEKLIEFSSTLLTAIKGKKLDELEAVDRVGTSTLTTDAFNNGLEALKAQV